MTFYNVQVLNIGHFSVECCWEIPWLRSARILWSWALACSTKSEGRSEEEVELFSTTNLRFILKLSLSVISRQDLYRQNNVILWYQHIKIEAPMAVNLSMYVSTVHWTLFSAHCPVNKIIHTIIGDMTNFIGIPFKAWSDDVWNTRLKLQYHFIRLVLGQFGHYHLLFHFKWVLGLDES